MARGLWIYQAESDRWILLAKKGNFQLRDSEVLVCWHMATEIDFRCQFEEKSVITPRSSDFLDPRRRLTGLCTPLPSLKISRKLAGS